MSYLKLLFIQINLPIFTDSKEHKLWSIYPGWAKRSWSSATHVSHHFPPFLKGFLNRSCPSLVFGVLEPSAAEVVEVRTLWGLCAQVYLRGLCFKRFCAGPFLQWHGGWLCWARLINWVERPNFINIIVYTNTWFSLVQQVPELFWFLQRHGTNGVDDR